MTTSKLRSQAACLPGGLEMFGGFSIALIRVGASGSDPNLPLTWPLRKFTINGFQGMLRGAAETRSSSIRNMANASSVVSKFSM